MAKVTHDSRQLVTIFNQLFDTSHQTRLVGGVAEPLYLPASGSERFHRIFFREDFFASALHEIAHWCLAGAKRRKQVDFGYWYEPDGRNAQQQARFELVEVRPQALQWIFSAAADYPFRLSMDNLSGEPTDDHMFGHRVFQQTIHYVRQGLPRRANLFGQALMEHYGTSICEESFSLRDS